MLKHVYYDEVCVDESIIEYAFNLVENPDVETFQDKFQDKLFPLLEVVNDGLIHNKIKQSSDSYLDCISYDSTNWITREMYSDGNIDYSFYADNSCNFFRADTLLDVALMNHMLVEMKRRRLSVSAGEILRLYNLICTDEVKSKIDKRIKEICE